MHYLLCSWSLSSLQHLLSFRCLFHYGSSLPGVEALVCIYVLFLSFFFFFFFKSCAACVPGCYSLSRALLRTRLICSWVWSHLVSSAPLITGKQMPYNTEACQAVSAVSYPQLLHHWTPFNLWAATKWGNPCRSILSPQWFIIYFTFLNNTPTRTSLLLELCVRRAEFNGHVGLDVNKQRRQQKII